MWHAVTWKRSNLIPAEGDKFEDTFFSTWFFRCPRARKECSGIGHEFIFFHLKNSIWSARTRPVRWECLFGRSSVSSRHNGGKYLPLWQCGITLTLSLFATDAYVKIGQGDSIPGKQAAFCSSPYWVPITMRAAWAWTAAWHHCDNNLCGIGKSFQVSEILSNVSIEFLHPMAASSAAEIRWHIKTIFRMYSHDATPRGLNRCGSESGM